MTADNLPSSSEDCAASDSIAVSTDAGRLVLSSPTALIAAVPYLIGYRPGRALVAVFVRGSDVALTVAATLPPDDHGAVAPDDLAAWSDSLIVRCRGAAAEAAYIVSFTATALADAALVDYAAADILRDRCGVEGIDVRDVLVVGSDRWRSLLCRSAACCPPEGRPRTDQDTHVTEAALVVAGAAPVASRRVLEHELDREVGPFAGWVRAASATRPQPGDLSTRALGAARDHHIDVLCEWLRGDAPVTEPLAESVLWLFDVRVRDTVLWELLGDPARWSACADRLAVLVRALPRGCIAPTATLLAGVRWACGDGARADVAVMAALDDDDEYVLARMVRAGVEGGIPPREWVECMRGLSREVIRHGSGGGRRRRPW